MQTFERLQRQIAFIYEIDKVKFILRKTRLFQSDRPENDAEHSWHLAMMAIVLAEHADQEIDLFKVVKMVLMHDLVEIDAGDVFFFDQNEQHDNRQEELEAAKRIFGLLPADQAQEFFDLWVEFETGQTPEAQFARVMDRLEPMLQNASNQGGTWQEYEVDYDTVLDSKRIMIGSATPLWEYTQQLLEECVEKGILRLKEK